jgi:hypothetical protein
MLLVTLGRLFELAARYRCRLIGQLQSRASGSERADGINGSGGRS